MSTNLNSSNPTPRTRVVRESQRAVYDRDAVNQILDEAFLCHVGFAVDGQPYVIPRPTGATEACSTSTAPRQPHVAQSRSGSSGLHHGHAA